MSADMYAFMFVVAVFAGMVLTGIGTNLLARWEKSRGENPYAADADVEAWRTEHWS